MFWETHHPLTVLSHASSAKMPNGGHCNKVAMPMYDGVKIISMVFEGHTC